MEMQLALWGDSVMKGVVWNSALGKYKLAAQNAAQWASNALGITLHNRSKMGCTSSKGLTIMQHDLDAGMSPQVALIEFGGNDCDFHWAEISEAPSANHLPNTLPAQFQTQMREMITTLRQKGIVPVLTTLVPNHAQRYFDFFTRNGLNKDTILQWLGDVGHIYRWHERYNCMVVSTAVEMECPLIDLRGSFLSQWHYEDLLCEDGIHPNEKGYALIGDTLKAEGQRLLHEGNRFAPLMQAL